MKKLAPILVSLTLFLSACTPAPAPEAEKEMQNQTPQSNQISTEEVQQANTEKSEESTIVKELEGIEVAYYADKPEVRGYLAQPEKEGDYPGIILIHEWWGLNDDIRQKADEFAAEGYIALAVDLYEGEFAQTPDEARILATDVRENTQEAFNHLSAALNYLKEEADADEERLASVGWCFGGQWSYEMAKNDLGTDVSIMYYGRFHPEDDLEMMKSNIIGHFGEDDAAIALDDVKQFQITLREHSDKHQIYIYENAGHSFANQGEAYDDEAATLAWERSLEFLEKQL